MFYSKAKENNTPNRTRDVTVVKAHSPMAVAVPSELLIFYFVMFAFEYQLCFLFKLSLKQQHDVFTSTSSITGMAYVV